MCHSLELSISLQRHIFQFSVFSTLLFCKHVPMVKIYLPKRDLSIIRPIFRSTPALEVGIPVSLAKFCFACVIPNALFHEKERPGMPVLDLRLVIITNVLKNYYH